MIVIRLNRTNKNTLKMLHFNCDNIEMNNPNTAYQDKRSFINAVEYDLRNSRHIESIDFEYSIDVCNAVRFNFYCICVKDFEPKFNQFIELVKSYKKVRENL